MAATGPVQPPLASLEITADSSLQGWGAWCSTRSTGGAWGPAEAALHINVLELKAIWLGVSALAAGACDTTIVVRTDNTTAMHCINNFGSVRSAALNALARQLWSWALQRNVTLKATHIPGVRNGIADSLSRAVWDDHSYSIHPSVFARIETHHRRFDVDLFADFSNYKVDVYVSWLRDPFAYAVDAFTVNWDTWLNLYAFPPFRLVDKCLSHLDRFPNCELSLICLFWPTQPSFARLLQRCVRPPLLLPTFENLLTDRRGQPHPLLRSRTLKLVVWRLAPLTCREKRRVFWQWLSEAQHDLRTRAVGEAGFVGDSPLDASINEVCNFLARLAHDGYTYSSINSYRSCLSYNLTPIEGFPVGAHPTVRRLLRGIFNANPPTKPRGPVWEVEDVLTLLDSWEPSSSLTTPRAAYKALILLLLTSTARIGEMADLRSEHRSAGSLT